MGNFGTKIFFSNLIIYLQFGEHPKDLLSVVFLLGEGGSREFELSQVLQGLEALNIAIFRDLVLTQQQSGNGWDLGNKLSKVSTLELIAEDFELYVSGSEVRNMPFMSLYRSYSLEIRELGEVFE